MQTQSVVPAIAMLGTSDIAALSGSGAADAISTSVTERSAQAA